MEMKKVCPVCGSAIIGRIDKKFCSDQCRNEFNNNQNRESNAKMRRVNLALKKNRRILEELKASGKYTVSRIRLEVRGFDFRYLTSYHTARNGETLFYCYDHGYLNLNKDLVMVVQRSYAEIEEINTPNEKDIQTGSYLFLE
jgi:predicted nucleic acid-binding Zn ribbon protein